MRPIAKPSLTFDNQSKLRWNKRVYVQRYVRLIERLVHMRWPEIAHRVGLAVQKKRTEKQYTPDLDSQEASRGIQAFMRSVGPSARDRMLSIYKERFFFAPSDKDIIIDALTKRIPVSARNTVVTADSINEGRFEILGKMLPVSMGSIDWHADPESLRHAWPEEFMTEDDAIRTSDADVKYVWEVNRHQFLTHLARAFWHSGNPEYARRACTLIDDWIDRNPVGRGVNWCSHLEVAMRSISWLWTMPYLLAWPDLDESFLRRWLQSIFHHHRHLASNLSIFTDPTNHLIGEATALWMMSTCIPDLPDALHQEERARKILERELINQVTEDGVNKEHASSYHRFVLDFYLQILVLSRKLGKPLSNSCERRIEAMLDYAAALAGSRCIAPMTGDSDDARGIPFPELVGWDFHDLLSTGAIVFNRPEWKYQAGDLSEASIWLAGVDAVRIFDRILKQSDTPSPVIFSRGGYGFFGSSYEGHEVELIFDTGPLGLWPNAAHGHADALSVLVRIDGDFLLTDSGTGAYFGPEHSRNAFRRTSAHNTVSVDGLDQADIFDTFKWVNPINTQLLHSCTSDEIFFATGVHNGYQRLRSPVTHYRSVLSTGSGGAWIIIDRLEGRGSHTVTRDFNFPPGLSLHQENTQHVRGINPASGHGLTFGFPATGGFKQVISCLDDGGIWSNRYGHIEPAPHLSVKTSGTLPMILFTYIDPVFVTGNSGLRSFTSHSPVINRDANGTLVCQEPNTGTDGKSTDTIVVNQSSREFMLPGGIRSNAELLFIRHDCNASISKALLVGEKRYLSASDFLLECKQNHSCATYHSQTTAPKTH